MQPRVEIVTSKWNFLMTLLLVFLPRLTLYRTHGSELQEGSKLAILEAVVVWVLCSQF